MNRKDLIIKFIFAVAFGAHCSVSGQIPQIGEPLPSFTLTTEKHAKRVTIGNEAFRGKWVLLHFWSLGCSSSVKSIMKMDTIQKQFKQALQVVLIGNNSHDRINAGIEEVYERLRVNRSLDLPVAYDSLLFGEWGVSAVPQIYVVDPNGIVRSITTGFDMTRDKIMKLLRGDSVNFHPVNVEYKLTSGKGLFNVDFEHDELLYSSILTRWDGERPKIGAELDRFVNYPDKYLSDGWAVAKLSLERLYQYAYFGRVFWSASDTAYYGKVYPKAIIEAENLKPFEHNFSSGKGTYNYYLRLPTDLITVKSIQKEIRKCLALNFGYEANVEMREMPVWKLVAYPGARAKLTSKGGKPQFLGYNPIAGVAVRNYSINRFLSLIAVNLPNPEGMAYIDGTNIEDGIDCNIQTDMTDFESVQAALQNYGLKLVESSRPMRVLVIRD